MMEAVRTSETSVDNHFTRQYIPEDNSEHHTRRRENLKSHIYNVLPRSVWNTQQNNVMLVGSSFIRFQPDIRTIIPWHAVSETLTRCFK
jgi:hypothetical protein